MHASVSVLATNDFAPLKLDERCQSPLVGSLTDRLGMEPGKIEQTKHEFQIFCTGLVRVIENLESHGI